MIFPKQIYNSIAAHKNAAATRLRRKAQGWPRFLRPTLGRDAMMRSTLKGLRPYSILFSHKTPAFRLYATAK
jgi:hypothetical protein